MPILIAAKGERVLRLAARWADAWNAAWFGFPDERFAQRRADLVTACEAEGRDPATLEMTVGVTIDSEAAAGRRSRPPSSRPMLTPSPGRSTPGETSAWPRPGRARPADERTIEPLLEARAPPPGREESRARPRTCRTTSATNRAMWDD